MSRWKTLISAMLICIGMSFVCWCPGFAQYAQEWRSPDLGYNGWGCMSLNADSGTDIDDDGIPEVLAISKKGAFEERTYYNGDQGYSVEWTISSSPYQSIASVWVADLDSDPNKEIIVVRYSYNPSTQYSFVGKISIYSCPAHQLEWESAEIEGFNWFSGIADVDNDGINEFSFSARNFADSTAYLYVYGYTGEGVKQQNASVKDAEVAYASQNYPNPFNATTVIRYRIPDLGGQKAETIIEIYNALGQRIRILTKGIKGPGSYTEMWNGENDRGTKVGSGVYFYQVQVGNFRTGKKMLMVR